VLATIGPNASGNAIPAARICEIDAAVIDDLSPYRDYGTAGGECL